MGRVLNALDWAFEHTPAGWPSRLIAAIAAVLKRRPILWLPFGGLVVVEWVLLYRCGAVG